MGANRSTSASTCGSEPGHDPIPSALTGFGGRGGCRPRPRGRGARRHHGSDRCRPRRSPPRRPRLLRHDLRHVRLHVRVFGPDRRRRDRGPEAWRENLARRFTAARRRARHLLFRHHRGVGNPGPDHQACRGPVAAASASHRRRLPLPPAVLPQRAGELSLRPHHVGLRGGRSARLHGAPLARGAARLRLGDRPVPDRGRGAFSERRRRWRRARQPRGALDGPQLRAAGNRLATPPGPGR